ncbi:glycosyltransferase involved in cell wall biosynthesis [Spirosoma lacussanchae]|uniref:glycosyltransferase family 2 protein n=1 Tax=Spirosoma lacussanchae TaxID=1884249 RepID=UPI00110843F7|nr:glycosyltransferase family 2 protein [Spirosoma lacussanchae]
MLDRLLARRIRLSYGITVCNEAVELERLILFLLVHKDAHDQILVLQDTTEPDPWVTDVLDRYRDQINVQTARLGGDFATFKNTLISMASGDYLFQIDADELPGKTLLRSLKGILRKHPQADCLAVPRINLVKGLTPEWIAAWRWQVDEQGRINYPDYQLRIFRLNQTIRWKNKVHEELAGYQHCHFLPADTDAYCLLHRKDIDRQKKQNDFYQSLG